MSPLFQLFLLFLHFFSTYTYSLNSTHPLDKGISNGEPTFRIDVNFSFPSPIPAWSEGKGFASGAINLGGLEVRQIKSFTRIWKSLKGGPHGTGATFFEPSSMPDDFFMLGSYAQSNDKALFGSVLVGKDLANGTLSQPTDYTLVWTAEDRNGFIWLPTPPNGYKSVGYIVTNTSEKPPLNKIRCVRSDFTDPCENDDWIWGDNGINFYKLRPTIRGVHAQGLSPGTFVVDNDAGKVLSCLKNLKNEFSFMPNKSQVIALVKEFSPIVYFHPKEELFPSSLEWVWNNRAFLFKKGDESNPVRINPLGSNLPVNMSGEGMYWMDLPQNEGDRDIVKKGDLNNAAVYLHVKPMYGATYTDIVIWIYYPFNGNGKLKLNPFFHQREGNKMPLEVSLGRLGEHVSDWEHVTLRISNFDGEMKSVYLSQHKNGIWVSAADLMYTKDKLNKFMIFSCLHSHALEPFPTTSVYKKIVGKAGLLKEAEKGNLFLDTGFKYFVVSAEYLGKGSEFVEPNWLGYAYDWGPKFEYEAGKEIHHLLKNFPIFFRPILKKILNKLPAELFGQEGPIGPKWKNNWVGDEDI